MTIKVLYFSASWCSPCKSFKPIVESVLKDKQDYELTIIDIEEEQELTSQYKVRSVPTIVFIKDNNIIDKFSGSVTKDILIAKIDAHRS